MDKLNLILEQAKKHKNINSIEDLEKFNLTEEEFVKIIEILKINGILIEKEEKYEEFDNFTQKNSEKDSTLVLVKEILSIPMLSSEQTLKLIEKAKNGDESARNKVIEGNLRLVLSIANKFNSNLPNHSSNLNLLDYFQEGCIGMSKAIYKFDINRGVKFSTYATWWIRQAMSRAYADKSKTIRIPVHEIAFISKMKKYISNYKFENGIEPSYEQISTYFGVPIEKVKEAVISSVEVTSLDKPVGEDKDTNLIDFLPDRGEDQYYALEQKMCYEQFFDIINERLDEREKFVILRRYPLTSNKIWTLEELGSSLKITRERVRQIEAKALKKIKRACAFNSLGEEMFLHR